MARIAKKDFPNFCTLPKIRKVFFVILFHSCRTSLSHFAHGYAVNSHLVRIGFYFTHNLSFCLLPCSKILVSRTISYALLSDRSFDMTGLSWEGPVFRMEHSCFSLLPCPYSYTIERFLVPSSCSSPIGTPDGTPMYQLPDQFPLVHRRAFSSTKRCFELCWYTNRHFPVPNANNYSVGTSICHFAYRSLVLSKKLLEAVLIFAP